MDQQADSVIWTKKVSNPEAYGVVNLNQNQEIVELVEKPQEFVSDQAVIGIYYFKEVSELRDELQYVLENDIIHGGEYQINDGIKRMMAKGKVFKTGTVDEWMDCGNKNVTIETNSKMLGFKEADGEELISDNVMLHLTQIIPPCYIADGVVLDNCVIGPNVSIGPNTKIYDSHVKNSIIQSSSTIKNATLDQAMIGNHAHFDGKFTRISIGDYSTLE